MTTHSMVRMPPPALGFFFFLGPAPTAFLKPPRMPIIIPWAWPLEPPPEWCFLRFFVPRFFDMPPPEPTLPRREPGIKPGRPPFDAAGPRK